jgi:hypothetical protein
VERSEFERRLATIQVRAEQKPGERIIDGFTPQEWLDIIDKIQKTEGYMSDTLSIIKYGIDKTYPELKVRYPEWIKD